MTTESIGITPGIMLLLMNMLCLEIIDRESPEPTLIREP